jgi:hypothetical protein
MCIPQSISFFIQPSNSCHTHGPDGFFDAATVVWGNEKLIVVDQLKILGTILSKDIKSRCSWLLGF